MRRNPDYYIPLHLRIEVGRRMATRKETKEKPSEISTETGISYSHLFSLEAKYKKDPSMVDAARPGRPKKIDERTERRIVRNVLKNPFESGAKLVKNINTEMEEELQISTRSFNRVPLNKGLKSCRPYYKFRLTPDHIRDRLLYAKKYKDKDMRFWRNVLFTDEIRLGLGGRDSQKRVRRPKGHRRDERFTLHYDKDFGGGLMFWGCFSWEGVGRLVVDGSINGGTYAQLLKDYIPPSLRELNMRTCYLLHDHAPAHDAKTVSDTLDILGIRTLENYPANSPDLNPIEELWSFWKRKVIDHNPHTLVELRTFAFQEWRNLQVDKIRSFIKRLPNTLNEVIRMKGKHTHY